MNNLKNKLISEFPVVSHNDVELYFKYLHNKLFRGFYYDSDEKSYGIVLSFSQDQTESFNLFAQESKSGTIIMEYKIHSGIFTIEQIAYDKVLISSTSHTEEIMTPEGRMPEIPKVIEFTILVLTRNSIYLRFLNHELYSSPISSFKGGLVLSLDHQYTHRNTSKIEVEAGEWF